MKKYFEIASESLWDQIVEYFGERGGVYKLRYLSDAENNGFEPTRRLLGTDPEGVLYIGKATSFASRVIDLKKSLLPDYESLSHHVGIRFSRNPTLREKFDVKKLCVTLHESAQPEETEREELQAYFRKFGELPPWNAKS